MSKKDPLDLFQRDSALSVCPWSCSYSNSHALGASFFIDFCVFNLGTSSAFSAVQRYGFVHVHILMLMPWGCVCEAIFAFFNLGTSSAFSAVQRYRFVHGHVHIESPKPWVPLFDPKVHPKFIEGTDAPSKLGFPQNYIIPFLRLDVTIPSSH